MTELSRRNLLGAIAALPMIRLLPGNEQEVVCTDLEALPRGQWKKAKWIILDEAQLTASEAVRLQKLLIEVTRPAPGPVTVYFDRVAVYLDRCLTFT